jgi:hypothetical protein
LAKGFSATVESAVIVQNTLTEVLQATIYGNIPADVVRVIEEYGVFGDITAGSYYTFLNNEEIIANQSGIDNVVTANFNLRDSVNTAKHPAKPGTVLRLFIFATAASPGRYKIRLKGKDFKLDELID